MKEPETKEELKEAEEIVLYQLQRAKVSVCGTLYDIAPLPAGPCKRFNSVLNKVLKGFKDVAGTAPEERTASIFGGQEELILESMVQGLLVLAGHYKWPDVDAAKIEDKMTTREIRAVLAAQVEINGEDDFLLLPSRVISQILSQTTETVVAKPGNQESTQASEKPGA